MNYFDLVDILSPFTIYTTNQINGQRITHKRNKDYIDAENNQEVGT